MISNKIVGSHIKSAREAAHMTQEKVAEKLTLSVGHYGHIERGTRPASLDLLDKLCHLFQVTLDTLLDGAMIDAHEILMQKQSFNYTAQFDELVRGCPDDLVEVMLTMCRTLSDYHRR